MKFSRAQEILIVSAILLLAAFLRVYRLDQLPPGLHYDEAFNATMAHRVLTGIERPIFFTEDLTEEPLAIYVTALAFALFGETTWTIRFVSALAGIATVAALHALARALFQSRVTAALAALTLAILYWHVNFSRLGMEPIFTPLMLTLAFAFLWKGIARGEEQGARHASRPSLLALSGTFFAATLYTYKAALFVPILFAAFVGLEILIDRKFWAQNGRGLVILVGVAILVFAPLGIYLVTHPEQFFERPNAVASSGAATIADSALKVAGMFFVQGDSNPRSNLPERPALDPFLALGFSIGIAICLARFRRDASARFLLLWLIVMSLPSILTDFAPHFGRTLAVTPALALIIAFGFASLFQHRTTYQLPLTLVLIAGFAFSAFSTARDYFFVWG
ncbi:MAG: glycosyltransferase family 39 protein, partial [Anaerolineales bacterium]|nr:glycosyltransferase family 39 protein [Anaerolineales bacterium]